MRRLILICGGALGLLSAQATMGHATVWPQESNAGAFQQYTIRVPNEKESPTVSVEAEIPPGPTVTSIEIKPGWDVQHRRDENGKIVGVTWSGGSIGLLEYERFNLVARNPEEGGNLIWRVVQVHADGSRTAWVGEPDSNNPAPVTMVKAGAPAAH